VEIRTPENYDAGIRIAQDMQGGDSNTGLKKRIAF
jgi:hypothetical protein